MEKLQKKSGATIGAYVVLLVVSVGLMFTLKNCRRFPDPARESTGEGDTLRVAMQYAPGSFYISGDTLAGRDYEALSRLGMPFKIFPITNPAEGLNGLKEGRYDVVVADMPQTADSAGEYLFTAPVYLDRQVLVQRLSASDSVPAITSPLQLREQTVVVAKDSPMASRLEHLEREIGGDINLVERDATSERLLIELALGADSVPLVVANAGLAAEVAAEYPQLDFSVAVSLTQFQPWILRRDRTVLRDTLNARLSR